MTSIDSSPALLVLRTIFEGLGTRISISLWILEPCATTPASCIW